jgi:phosphocarrier protein
MSWPARNEPLDVSEGGVRTVEIVNKRGLHARASAKFVKCASTFEAEVRVSKDGHTVDARSIMGLMMLAAGPGCCIEIEAEGAEAEAALDALVELVTSRFDEEE